MTADQFRALALSLPDAVESRHMNHPDFRINGRVCATPGDPDNGTAAEYLTQTATG